MEAIANKIVSYLDTDQTIWNDIKRMQMILGVQVLYEGDLAIRSRCTKFAP